MRDNFVTPRCLVHMTSRSAHIIHLSDHRPRQQPLTVDAALDLHLDTLFSTARLLCRNDALAQDLVQETAVKAVRSWGQLAAQDSVRAWLLQILRRTFLNHVRDDRRQPQIADIALEDLALVVDEAAQAHVSRAEVAGVLAELLGQVLLKRFGSSMPKN